MFLFMSYSFIFIPFSIKTSFVLDASTDAPPSFRPAKKYSDMSGLLVSWNTSSNTVNDVYLIGNKAFYFK